MSKIVCDICGTSYPETAKQCPICCSVRPGDAQRVTNEVKSDGKVSTGYTHVKGGKFSKSNVKKRTKAQSKNNDNSKKSSQSKHNDEEPKSNRGLVLLAIMLLLAIIGVVAYMAVRILAPYSDPNPTNPSDYINDDIDLTCRDLTLDTYTIVFDQEGIAKLLNVKTTPEKPSEPVKFTSDNEAVATVNDKGKITAVAEGTAKITVTCGKVSKECVVTVQFANKDTTPDETTVPTTDPDTTTPSNPSDSTNELRLNRKEFTLSYKGETWDLYSGSIPRNQITWSVGDKSVATVDNGKVVAVGNGYTYVYAEYEGQKVSCQVICSFKEGSGVIGNGGVSEDGGGSSSGAVIGIVTATDALHVRSNPSTGSASLGFLYPNEKVTILEQKTVGDMKWGKISHNGQDAWVSMDYIKIG